MTSIQELKNLRNIIDNVNPLYHKEIFNIIKEFNMQYSENKNGIFINMNNIQEECMVKIYSYLEYIKKQEKTFADVENIKKDFKKDFFSNFKKKKDNEKIHNADNTDNDNTDNDNTDNDNTDNDNTDNDNTGKTGKKTKKPDKKTKKPDKKTKKLIKNTMTI